MNIWQCHYTDSLSLKNVKCLALTFNMGHLHCFHGPTVGILYGPAAPTVEHLPPYEYKMSHFLSNAQGNGNLGGPGIAIDRAISGWWALWEENALKLPNQSVCYIGYKHKPYNNVK